MRTDCAYEGPVVKLHLLATAIVYNNTTYVTSYMAKAHLACATRASRDGASGSLLAADGALGLGGAAARRPGRLPQGRAQERARI